MTLNFVQSLEVFMSVDMLSCPYENKSRVLSAAFARREAFSEYTGYLVFFAMIFIMHDLVYP